jgi:hypothetical protein
MNWLFWRRQKAKAKPKRRKRRLQQATVGQQVALDSQHVVHTSAGIYRQLNELILLLTKHDLFLREDHHNKALVPLTRFISQNFYKLSRPQQQEVRRNLEFIETDKYILSALANSRRLRVVEILSVIRSKNITNRQYVSERVNRLVEAGLLERTRIGKKVYYSKINQEPSASDMSGEK